MRKWKGNKQDKLRKHEHHGVLKIKKWTIHGNFEKWKRIENIEYRNDKVNWGAWKKVLGYVKWNSAKD